jgi:hypothetical protein
MHGKSYRHQPPKARLLLVPEFLVYESFPVIIHVVEQGNQLIP